MKKNIDLIIDGVKPEKVMYDTDNHSLVVLYPAQKEFKRGDIVFENGRIMIVKDMPFYYYVLYYRNSNSIYTNSIYGIPFSDRRVRLATPEEQQVLFDALAKEGKKWNAETLEIEEIVPEFKRGDILASDDALFIFDEYANKEKDVLHSIWNNIGMSNKNWITNYFKHATDEQKAQVHELLRKEGKKWNEETLEIEDLEISDIVVDLKTACEYLNKKVPNFSSIFFSLSVEDYNKYYAQITLQLIREAWNKFDEFEVDYANSEQGKYFPVLDVCGDINFIASWGTTHISSSCLSFPTQERALQFGKQFKELFKIALGL